ncbi:MAG: outer membrane protein assembly factor BamE [Gammaproteobacteria bacterium]|nr:outer membrane protein assembly factor BamE [Gammaproteobacteria bacterium]
MRILYLGLVLTVLSACGGVGFPGVYRIDVEQGNIITQEMVDQLKPGMNRSQVRFILGTPLVEDSFHQNRWDYIYIVRNGNTIKQSKRLSVFFDGNELSHFTGTFVPSEGES